MILFFDLPNVSKKEAREYRKFLKMIKENGFVMLQESVYTKLALNESVVESTLGVIRKQLPPSGMVSILTITETQFSSIENLLGEIKSDVVISDERVIKL